MSYAAICFAQYDYLPKVGIKDFATYQQSSIDSVDLDTGNVNLHIPLIGFPQKGNKLRLNFIVRYNEPQWLSTIGTPLYNPTIGGYTVAGVWKLKNFNNPRPLGVDVVRDQAVTSTYDMTSRIAPGCCGNGDPVDYYSEAKGIRDRSGAEHTLSVWAGAVGAPRVNFPAPDGSGWVVASGGVKDKEGVTYSSSTVQSGGVSRPAWNISDAHGNTITTNLNGWHDSMDRDIPGSWSGHGAGASSLNGSVPLEDDPFPGVPSSETARCNNGAVATRTWTVPASSDSGGSQTYYFCFSKYTANTHFNFNGRLGQVNSAVLDETSFDAYLLTKIILPNDKSYSFQYDSNFLDLTRIDLPTGGVIVYTWGTVKWDNCSTALPMKRVVIARSVTTGDGVSSWSYNWGNGGVCNPQPGDTIPVIVSNPDQNDEWHHQSRMEDNGKLNRYVVSYKGHAGGDAYNATGTISKIVKTSSSFRQTPLFTQTQDILVSPDAGPDGPIVKWLQGYSTPEAIPGPIEKTVVTLYDTATQNVVSSQETDATPVPSSGTIERWNPDNYWYPAHDTCACVNYSEVKSEQVYDFVQGSGSGPGTLLRETDTTYRFQDTGGADYENNGLTGLPSQVKVYDGTSHQVAQTNYVYDEASYSSGLIAGELTSVKKWKDGSSHDDTHISFNSDGTWSESVDANGIKTHANSFDCSNAFPKSVTKAYGTSIAETFGYSHDCNTGRVTSYIDANLKTTSYTYADALNRVTGVDYPDGGHTGISYVDGANSSTTIEVDTGGTQGKMSQTVSYDLVGRTIKVQQNAGTDVISVDTHYDAMGHVYTTSNPYTSTQGSSSVVTTNTYDELGRLIQKTNQDHTSQIISYSGNVVTTKDELGNAWQRTSDALGELTQVVEPNGATTNYTYTGRGDLLTVSQPGLSGETARTRSFDYDWLSRLKQSFNPESGWICYGNTSGGAPTGSNCTADYDGNGNLNHKTDARGVVTSYSYDSLNRLISKTYSDGVTPGDYYTYDVAPGWMPDLQNVVGRLAYYGNSSGEASAATFSYDAMGRVKRKWQQTPSSAPGGYFASAEYDLAGNMTALTYPDGRRVTQDFDNAGRMSGVSYDKWGNTSIGTSYFSSPSYDPAGHLTGGAIGYSLHYTASYDNRLRQASYGYLDNGPSYLLTKGLSWQANGNLDSEINWINGTKRQYGYDSLNRLTSAVDVVNSSTSTGAPISYPSSGSSSTSSTNVLPNANTIWGSTWGRTDVSVTDNGTTGPDGSMTATVLVAGGGGNSAVSGHLGSLASTYIGTAMTGSVWLRSPGGNKTINIYLVTNFAWGGYQPIYKQITVTPTWQQFSITSTIPNDITDLQFQIGGGYTYAIGEIDVWGARVEPSSSVGSTVTNFLEYSQRLNGFPWSSGGLSVADNAADAPDGTHTAALLTVNQGASNAYMINVIASPAPYSNTMVTTSVWLRVPSGTKTFPLYFQEVGAINAGWVTMQTVTVTTDWQRFSLSGVTQDSLSYLALQIGGDNSLQSGQLEVWGAQMELGSSASPYIPTGSQPVSRGANFTNILAYSQLVHQFEWTIAGGSMANNSAVAPDGTTTAATMTPGSGSHDAFVYDVAPMPAMYDGATLAGSVYLRVPSGTLSTNLQLINNSVVKKAVPITLTTNWQRFTVTDTVIHGLTELSLQVGGGNTIGEGHPFQIWGAQMEVASTAGPYVATYATPITAGNEYVNLLPFSQQLNGPTWWYSLGDTVQVNAATAPDQTQTAATVTCVPSGHANGACDTWVSDQVPNPAMYSGSTVTASVYLRSPGGARTVNLSVISEGAEGHVSSWTQVTLTQNWQRFPITATLQNGLTYLALTIGGGGSFTSGSIEVWGAQLVNGTSAGSYDATGGGNGTPLGQPGALVPNGLFETYAYDSFGNVKQSGNFTFWQNYDANNRLVGYQYDAAGNLLADGISNIMTWDAENRIRSANGTTYVYDAEGNRVSKSGVGMTDTVYFGGKPIARLQAEQWTDLIYGPMGLLAEVPGTQNGSTSYRLLDHLGTQVATTDASGALTSVTDSAPFGQIFTGGSSDPYKFTGKERDAESGLDYFGARYYGSSMGRFMSADWSSVPQPVPYANLGNPQTLNLYAYAGNNPVSIGDATGHNPGPLFPIINGWDIMLGEIEIYQQQKQNDMHNSGAAQQSACNADACATAKMSWLSRVGGWFSGKVGAAGIAFARFGRLGGLRIEPRWVAFLGFFKKTAIRLRRRSTFQPRTARKVIAS